MVDKDQFCHAASETQIWICHCGADISQWERVSKTSCQHTMDHAKNDSFKHWGCQWKEKATTWEPPSYFELPAPCKKAKTNANDVPVLACHPARCKVYIRTAHLWCPQHNSILTGSMPCYYLPWGLEYNHRGGEQKHLILIAPIFFNLRKTFETIVWKINIIPLVDQSIPVKNSHTSIVTNYGDWIIFRNVDDRIERGSRTLPTDDWGGDFASEKGWSWSWITFTRSSRRGMEQ